jgi:hypothetical protein
MSVYLSPVGEHCCECTLGRVLDSGCLCVIGGGLPIGGHGSTLTERSVCVGTLGKGWPRICPEHLMGRVLVQAKQHITRCCLYGKPRPVS